MSVELSRCDEGDFSFIASDPAFSAGVLADPGFEIVREELGVSLAELERSVTDVVCDRHDRPVRALCGMELRSPSQISWEEFHSFNKEYHARLEAFGVIVDGVNPLARTNVVPLVDPVDEVLVHAITFTVPSQTQQRTYVVAGAAEVDGNAEEDVIAPEGSAEEVALAKAEFVLGRMTERMKALGVARQSNTSTRVFADITVPASFWRQAATKVGQPDSSVIHCVATPPIKGLEFEMDVRAVGSAR